MHPVDAAELGPGDRVGDAKEVLGWFRCRARPSTCAVVYAQLVDHVHDVGRWAVARVDNGKVEGVRRGPAEGELQGEMQGVEVAIGRAGERPDDGRARDVLGMKVALDDVVGPLAAVLVRGP